MPSGFQELAGAYGPISLEDQTRRYQCHQHLKNLVSEKYSAKEPGAHFWLPTGNLGAATNIDVCREKIVLAARIIAAVDNPADVCVISARPYGQRAVLKFAAHTGAVAIAGRFTPGNFTNYITRSFREPRLIIVTDPRTDAQAIKEASYVNIPVIALCDTDSPTEFVDVAIPTNNKGRHAIGLVWWLLAREVLRLRGTLADREVAWDVVVDLYFYRDPEQEEQKDEENKPGVDEAGAGAVDRGFTDNADWTGEPGAGVPGIAGASTADPNWTDNATGGEWATEGAPAAEGAAAPPSGW